MFVLEHEGPVTPGLQASCLTSAPWRLPFYYTCVTGELPLIP